MKYIVQFYTTRLSLEKFTKLMTIVSRHKSNIKYELQNYIITCNNERDSELIQEEMENCGLKGICTVEC